MLGTQCLVFSPDKKYILVGKRSLSEIYYPGAIVNVGGMLELNDLEKQPKDALMREVYEEIQIPLKFDASLKAILVGWNKISVTFLISTTIIASHNFDYKKEVIPADKNEFESNLYWISVNDIKNLLPDQLFDGLNYYRSELLKS